MKYYISTILFLFMGLGGILSVQAQDQDFRIFLKSGTVEAGEASALQWEPALHAQNRYQQHYVVLLQFNEIPEAEAKTALAADGIHLLHYIPNFAYLTQVSASISAGQLANHDVRRVRAIQAKDKLSRPLLAGNYPDYALIGSEDILLNAYPYTPAQFPAMVQSLRANEFALPAMESGRNSITIQVPLSRISDLSQLPLVRYLETVEAPAIPEDLRGRSLHRANTLSQAPGTGFDGTGVVMGIADDGGISHIDFQGRLTDFNSSAGGTHGDMVSGIACGSGNLDPTKIGMATGAYLNMYGISGYPHVVNAISNLNTLGTVVTSTSYSQGCGGLYDGTAQSLDSDVYNENALLHVFSAGNSASSTCSGVYGSLLAPDGYYYGNITGGRKAAKSSIATANLEYDDDRTLSSSRGPCEDGRLKPDISANGTGQLTTAPNNTYQTGGGTSAASPGIAGVSAMMYQAYKAGHSGSNPPSSLIKALLLNTADDLGRPGPDYDFGWGRVNARRALQVLQSNQYLTSSVSNNGSNNHTLTVPAGTKQVKVMVYWLDPAGSTSASKALVNDLDITLSSGGSTYRPWILSTAANIDSLQAPARRGVDQLNNMEQVTLDNPAAGNYTLNVAGTTVPSGPQSYHVVYEFVQDDIVVTYPMGGESFVPGESQTLRWDAFGSTGNFTIQYSTNNGATWTNITTSVSGSQRFYNWTPPSTVTGDALIRVSRGSLTGQSAATFNIIGLPTTLSMTTASPGTSTISWSAVSGANEYDVYALGAQYMQIIGTTSSTSFNVTGLTVGESNWYSVRARNTSGITGRRANAIEHEHGTTPGCTGCVTTITNFPYVEGFESSFGDFCQNSNDDLDWTRLTGSTGSSNTGPTAANSGSYYAYIEASSPNYPSKNGILTTACFDLGSASNASFSFDYHMYGAAMGSLNVQISTDQGTTWTTLWTRTGDQTNIWNNASINLASYLGSTVTLRFFGTTGTSFTSDIAIDDVTLSATAPTTCQTTIGTFPYTESFETGFGDWQQESGDDFDWSRNSGGTPSLNTGPTAAADGIWYLFTETSSPNYPTKTALLTGPCFDLSGATGGDFAFSYHMYGAGMGTFSIIASTDGGNTWSAPVWTRTGDQGNAWDRDTISLAPYAGSTVGFRLVATSANNWESDISIDDIVVALATQNPPVSITCPGTQNVNANASCQASLPDYTSLANVTGGNNPTVTQSPPAGTSISVNTTVTLTASDGNSSDNCSFQVQFNDVTPPTISCPGNQTIAASASCQGSLGDYTSLATASDNCNGNLVITQSPQAGTSINGTTQVTLSTTDGTNVTNCSFQVSLDDVTPPTISCPGNQSVVASATCQGSLGDYTSLATASDNCNGNLVITQSPQAGTTINGATQITLSTTDGTNSANCSFQVSLDDVTPPSVSCPPNQTLTSSSTCSPTLSDYASLAIASDNCTANPSLSQVPAAGTLISSTTVVTVTATDGAGNQSSCNTTISVSTMSLSFSVTDESAPNANDGAIDLTVSGGQSPYTYSWSTTATTEDVSGLTGGNYQVTVRGQDNCEQTGSATVNTGQGPAGLTMEYGQVSGVGNSWQTVTLNQTFTSMVVVATPVLPSSSDLPVVSRVRNASGSSFELRIQVPAGTATSTYDVHYVVVEEGVYTAGTDGINMEAVKFNSTQTAENNNWIFENHSYSNTYTSPVVLGQVMTDNNAAWSVFWASLNNSRLDPPAAAGFAAGKNVSEDPSTARLDETVGYVVMEAGAHTVGDLKFVAGLGPDIVAGPNATGYTYSVAGMPQGEVAVLSTAGLDGGNGGWPVLFGSNPVSGSNITLVFDEDQAGDTERSHTTEEVAYLVFEDTTYAPQNLVLEHATISNVGDSWQTVNLQNTYTNMVVVATPVLSSTSADPVVSRVRNASGSSFELRVQNPSGTAVSGYDVHYVVVEEGVYTTGQHGVDLEARTVSSLVTAYKNNWGNVETRFYQNSYSSPVVLGQVMSENDVDWSVFWASNGSQNTPPSATAIAAGKHVGEDTDQIRANETLGLIILEAGSGTLGGDTYEAGLGSDIVQGPGNSAVGYTYPVGSFSSTATAVLSAAAMDGGDGGWPVLFGATPLSSSAVTLIIDEDQVGDTERSHTTEQVAYLVFGQAVASRQGSDNSLNLTVNKELRLYPNPTANRLNLAYEFAVDGPVAVAVFGLDGKHIFTQTFEVQAGEQVLNLDTDQLAAGTYYLRMNAKDDMHSARFIKIK